MEYNIGKEEAEEIHLLNENALRLIEVLKKTTAHIEFLPQGSTTITRTVHGTLIGYEHDFKRAFQYIPRQTFLPYFDMNLRQWRTLHISNIIFDKKQENTEEPMKKDTIILHCSATMPKQDIGATDIDCWHRQRGFNSIGYHYVVRLDGTIETGRPYDKDGAHAIGWNKRAVGICYVGGLNSEGHATDTRTPQQRAALLKLIIKLHREHPELVHIFGHRDIAAKACPCFNASTEYGELLLL